jgi:hypothetical protein
MLCPVLCEILTRLVTRCRITFPAKPPKTTGNLIGESECRALRGCASEARHIRLSFRSTERGQLPFSSCGINALEAVLLALEGDYLTTAGGLLGH